MQTKIQDIDINFDWTTKYEIKVYGAWGLEQFIQVK